MLLAGHLKTSRKDYLQGELNSKRKHEYCEQTAKAI